MNKVNVSFTKMYDDVVVPEFETLKAAGCDVKAYLPDLKTVVIWPGEWELIKTGLKVDMLSDCGVPEVQVRPRSGLAYKHGVTVLNAPGTVDGDYTGEIGVILINHDKRPFVVSHGDRVAQLVFNVLPFVEGVSHKEVSRDPKGFGTTGVK